MHQSWLYKNIDALDKEITILQSKPVFVFYQVKTLKVRCRLVEGF